MDRLLCQKFYLKKVFGVRKTVVCKKVIEQIKQIELKTKKVLSGKVIGSASTKHKGAGFDFDQVREYVQGDDLRFIDWKSTARASRLLTKQYFIERNYRILIALDVSSSSFVGIGQRSKYDYLSEIAAIFSLVAEYNKDEVGLVLFSDKIDVQLPIKSGKAHNFKILETIFGLELKADMSSLSGTNLDFLFQKLGQILKQKSLVVLISDFIDEHDYAAKLKALQAKHDVIVVRYLDQLDQLIPNVGILPISDPESNRQAMLDTRFLDEQHAGLNLALKNRIKQQDELFRSCGVDLLQIGSTAHPALEVVKFFKKRLTY